MEKSVMVQALHALRASSKPRKFKQTLDMSINFKGLDFKKPENQVDVEVRLPHSIGKGAGKVLAFVRDKNFASQLKDKADRIVMEDEIKGLSKKEVNELVQTYNGFIAEGPVMLTVAKHLGQQLAPKGKMPKPVEPALTAGLEELIAQIKSVVRVSNKRGKFMPVVHVSVGKEDMADEEIAENMHSVYHTVINTLPAKEMNVKSLYVKMTMSPPILIGAKQKLPASEPPKQQPTPGGENP
ncbi:MAG: hypothetical protein HY393_01400 [Candidatus Diapherotrites archaeon]|nr:hypothetical protein [Candidatus Diapherotrites archaeon]